MQKAGLLLCDEIATSYKGEPGNYRAMFRQFLPELSFTEYAVNEGQFPKSAQECDVWLVSGSRHSVYEPIDWILRLNDFVRSVAASDSKFIGLCFGHQLLGYALGGQTEKASGGWHVGVHKFDIITRKKWMNPFKPSFSLQMSCQDQVTQLPPGAELLAGKPSCPNGVIMLGDNILGIQGHPEFPAEYVRALIEIRRERIGEAKSREALEHIADPCDTALWRSWIMNFIEEE